MKHLWKTLVFQIKWWRWFLGGPVISRNETRENLRIRMMRHAANEPKWEP